MSDYRELSDSTLLALRASSFIGDVAKESIAAELAERARVSGRAIPQKRKAPAPPRAQLRESVHLVVGWAYLESDNLKKNSFTKIDGEKRRRFNTALLGFRERVQEQYRGAPTSGPVAIDCVIYFPDNRVTDCANYAKIIGDGLKDLVLTDDRWQVLADTRYRAGGIDADNPRVEIVVSAIEPGVSALQNHEAK